MFTRRFSAVNCGHCVCPRIKDRKPMHPACPNFQKRLTYDDMEEIIEAIRAGKLPIEEIPWPR